MYSSSFTQRRSLIKLVVSTLAIVLSIFTGYSAGQVINPGGRNNPYSPSPGSKVLQGQTVSVTTADETAPNPQIAMVQRANHAGKGIEANSRRPTEVYHVGVGDVLFIDLKNTDQGSGYFTVRADGTIDYPLAGDNVIAAGNSVDTIESILQSGIKLFQDPSVAVTVREFGSHKISVTGMVENGGEKSLQREAIPLYVVRAEVGVDPKAAGVIITRGPFSTNESYDLHDAETDNVLVYPGNTVEFTDENGSTNNAGGYYYIGGEVNSSGQKPLLTGLTLYQAIVAAGTPKNDPKKATIRRKNSRGLFDVLEHNLKAIRDGKAADPTLFSGDVVEIRK